MNNSNSPLSKLKKFKNKIDKKSSIDHFDKIIFAALSIALLITVVFILIAKFTGSIYSVSEDENVLNEYSHTNQFQMRTYGEEQTKNMENLETPANELDPISCWGDSFFVAPNSTMPSLAAYVSKYTNRIVYNISVPSDSLEMIAARQGGVPMFVSACDIRRDKVPIEVTVSNSYNTTLTPSLEKNGGLNPCTINGIEGVLYSSGGKYYFTRSQSGNEEIIANSTTPVVTRAMALRRGDISVFFAGDDEIFADTEKTIEIYRKMTEYLQTDKYLIIGPVYGEKEVVDNVNTELERAFGDKYFNLLSYLCNDAVEKYSLKLSDEDKALVENGILSPGYFSADGFFTNDVNEIAGNAISEKLTELKYFEQKG